MALVRWSLAKLVGVHVQQDQRLFRKGHGAHDGSDVPHHGFGAGGTQHDLEPELGLGALEWRWVGFAHDDASREILT